MDYPYPIHYLGIEEQEETLKDYPHLLDIIPYNNANRKLLGMVIAYLQDFTVMIMLDDDNYPITHDFFTHHQIVGTERTIPLIQSSSGWFNTCEYLTEEHNMPFYYRGFPWSQRTIQKPPIKTHTKKAKIVVNSGFWLGDPDIDAVTRLYWPIRAIDMKKEVSPTFGLFPGTWCPFNNQNTAITREVLPAYFTPPNALRFSDLFPAYIICRIADHLNHTITYGFPFVQQRRNPHDLWGDITLEIVGAQATETLIEFLRSIRLHGRTYHDCLGEILHHFNAKHNIIDNCPNDQQTMLTDFFNNMKIYYDVFTAIQNQITSISKVQ